MSDKKSSSLKLRVLSSLLIVPVFLGSIYLGNTVFFIFLSVLMFISFHEWSSMSSKGQGVFKKTILGTVYITIGLASLFFVRHLHNDGLYLTFALLFMIWGCDTGAYFAGKTLGRNKLCPSISPGKTWEGLIGGVTASIAVAITAHYYGGLYLSVPVAVFIGLMVAITGQVGDLLISKFKRIVGVKDTGRIIPGHGGVLDRIDSLLLATPIYLIAVLYLHQVV